MPPEFLRHPGIGIGVLAQGEEPSAAGPAVSAGDGKRDDHAVTRDQGLNRRAHLDDLTHEFVPQDVSSLHRRDIAVVYVEIGTADGGGGDAHDRIPRIEDLRIGDLLDAHIFLAVPAGRFHGVPPGGWAGPAPGSVLSDCVTSPVSISCLRARRSSSSCCPGAWRNTFAIMVPTEPAGSW